MTSLTQSVFAVHIQIYTLALLLLSDLSINHRWQNGLVYVDGKEKSF